MEVVEVVKVVKRVNGHEDDGEENRYGMEGSGGRETETMMMTTARSGMEWRWSRRMCWPGPDLE